MIKITDFQELTPGDRWHYTHSPGGILGCKAVLQVIEVDTSYTIKAHSRHSKSRPELTYPSEDRFYPAVSFTVISSTTHPNAVGHTWYITHEAINKWAATPTEIKVIRN